MNKKEKELFDSAQPYIAGMPFTKFYIFSLDKEYNGTWGKNGFNSFGIVVEGINGNMYKVDYDVDIVELYCGAALAMEIASADNMIMYYSYHDTKFAINTIASRIYIDIVD